MKLLNYMKNIWDKKYMTRGTTPFNLVNISFKKIICFIFGHAFETYADEYGEQAWYCPWCHKELDYNDQYYGLNLSWRVTHLFSNLKNKIKNLGEDELPF